jgi:soluble P-type ATPase
MKTSLYLEAKVENKKLVYPVNAYKVKFNNFLESLPDNSKLEIFISVADSKGSLAQLAKIHAIIKELANDLGYTFDDMKLEVKRRAGLVITTSTETHIKSFKDCDKSELNGVIQTLIEIGDFSGSNLRT